ncbi:2697_t:CDS:2 [Dentiscutata erythropus]|uniref:2697_t:CDS:1 n=1 Tax=Dentiscutata erythropus TaxID=1348616 RepID=A0A9N9F6C2_9GLOM|nr:2697_t:CDS:2 [Dentiscutata erythropus]
MSRKITKLTDSYEDNDEFKKLKQYPNAFMCIYWFVSLIGFSIMSASLYYNWVFEIFATWKFE